ncbi:hypothetical protein [Arthrobacter sp. JCM 19049]|uniref:hypothetical protein n=1 Tax=Arthrobacter sp. JCM 19049 TaxID=1460643 RepID=UPI0006D0A629|nr:hypothetical protein [Arthrobacter sp. JCM 19049]
MTEALQQIRKGRINHNPLRAFHYLAQDMEQAAKTAFGPFVAAMKALQGQLGNAANTKSYYRKGDYALAGPAGWLRSPRLPAVEVLATGAVRRAKVRFTCLMWSPCLGRRRESFTWRTDDQALPGRLRVPGSVR